MTIERKTERLIDINNEIQSKMMEYITQPSEELYHEIEGLITEAKIIKKLPTT